MLVSGERLFTITNTMKSSVTVFWTQVAGIAAGVDKSMQVFSVTPETATLKHNASVTFAVTFRPNKDSFYYFQQL